MITRLEQKALFESISGDLVINTKPDGSGSNITIPISVYWGSEPTELTLPAITLRFIILDNPTMKTLGDYWKDTDLGEFTGYIAESTLMIKIRAQDYGSNEEDNYINQDDIVQALHKRIIDAALFKWDSLIEDGGVADGGISPANDISEILDYELLKEIQLSIRLQKLTGGVPTDTGPVLFSTAPTLLEVERKVEFKEIGD